MPKTPPPLPTGAHAAAAGRWVAHAQRLLVAYPNQELTIGLDHDTPVCTSLPSWTTDTVLTAHDRLSHHAALDPTQAVCLFGPIDGHAKVCLRLGGFGNTPCLNGAIGAFGRNTSFQSATPTTWDGIAQILGLVCEANAYGTSFHRTFLWMLMGLESGGQTMRVDRMDERRAETLAHVSKVRHHGGTTAGLRAPAITDPAERAALGTWLFEATRVARTAALSAFAQTRAALDHAHPPCTQDT